MKAIVRLAALSVMAVMSAAHAQSSLTVYGVADVALSYVSGVEGKTRMVSGMMEGSRVGLTGSEDLGGGFRTVFTLENRFETDTGAMSNRPPSGSRLPERFNTAAALGLPAPYQPAVSAVAARIGGNIGVNHLTGKLFDRQAFVGLVTPVGALLAGYQYTPAFEVAATFDVMKNESSLSLGHVIAFPASVEIRVENAAAYRLQTGPWTASLMYAFGEGSALSGRLISVNGLYKSTPFSVGLAYQSRENERGERSLTNFTVGVAGALGPGELSAVVVDIDDPHPRGLSPLRAGLATQVGAPVAATVMDAFAEALAQDALGYQIGYRIRRNAHTVSTAYNRFDDRTGRRLNVKSFGVVYSYAFSRRTDLNVVLTQFINDRHAQAAPGAQGFFGGFTLSAGRDTHNVALGLRHRF